MFLQINEDLDGEVKFLTQTGPFNVPVTCSTKKCDVSFQFIFVLISYFKVYYNLHDIPCP